MNFDPSKVIHNPTSLPDGEYYVGDSLEEIEWDFNSGATFLKYTVRDNRLPETDHELSYWLMYHPIQLESQHTNTHRTKHRRVLAPLYLRMK